MINPLQPPLQSLEVELAVSCRVELPPEFLDALIALVLRLLHFHLQFRDNIRYRHSRAGQSWYLGHGSVGGNGIGM